MWKFVALMFFITPLCAEKHVLVFAGSTQKESVNKKLAIVAAKAAKSEGAKVTFAFYLKLKFSLKIANIANFSFNGLSDKLCIYFKLI